jgi:hypothetical protein
MGMRMPDLGFAIITVRSNVTPADVPAVRKMWFGFDG